MSYTNLASLLPYLLLGTGIWCSVTFGIVGYLVAKSISVQKTINYQIAQYLQIQDTQTERILNLNRSIALSLRKNNSDIERLQNQLSFHFPVADTIGHNRHRRAV